MKKTIEIFKALADKTRLRILKLLLRKELCVCELVEILQLPQYHISRHLGTLKRVRLVNDRREGTWMYYSVAPSDNEAIRELMKLLDTCVTDEVLEEDLARAEKRLSRRVRGKCVLGYEAK